VVVHPRKNSFAAVTALLIALAFLFTPVLQPCNFTDQLSAESTDAQNPIQEVDDPSPLSPDDFITRNWDWSGYADENGMVKVIVSESSTQPEALSAFRAFQTHSFSKAFSGFSAMVSVDVLVRYASGTNHVLDVYPDLPVNASLADSVPQIGADQVWSMTDSQGQYVRGTGVVVAVIDTGIDYNHPDLGGGYGPGYKVIGGYDYHNNDADPMDDNGHGTHVAGIIAADGGMTGVAPGASLLAYKSLGSDGSGSMSNVILAIAAAMDPNGDGNPSDRADVISMSLGGGGEEGDPVCLAVRNAVNAGIVVVVAAGNSGPAMGTVASPGIAPEAVTVGAVDDAGALASFSSRGSPDNLLIKPEISAPGVGIISTVPYSGGRHSSSTGYAPLSGTSMATPHVSGAAALLLQLHPDWTPAQTKSALISSSKPVQASLWHAGAGILWIPSATSQKVFAEEPLISYGLADNTGHTAIVTNRGPTVSFTTGTSDRYSISASGSKDADYWANSSSVSPTSLSVSTGSEGQITLSVGAGLLSAPEGYYEGNIVLSSQNGNIRIPFGYAILSKLTVHVLDTLGREVFDPYGAVMVYNTPKADIGFIARGDNVPAPPAIFMLPSGDFSVHAAGHQLIYTYSEPYVLSGTVTIPRTQEIEITLRMADAKRMVIDLATDDGVPIFVKDYRVFCRYVGDNNASFHLFGSDYSILGSDYFTIPTSKPVYVSETSATVGISIAGFAYTPTMYDFISRNWEHWYEYRNSSHQFYMESTADLQYLLAWEFPGVDDSTPTNLEIDPVKTSVYDTKYDLSGMIHDPWGMVDTHMSVGAESSFYLRRDTEASLNPFFTGMHRRTIVQGVWSEPYFPEQVTRGYFSLQYYESDWTHRVRADTMSEIYMSDRFSLLPVEGLSVTQRVGAGPYYPALTTWNTNTSIIMIYPVLRDQSGTAVGGVYVPSLTLYRDGGLAGIYQLSEYLARRYPMRVINLTDSGSYTAEITYAPNLQICDDVTISLHFSVPAVDVNPPQIKGLYMSQRFVPGSLLPVQLVTEDDKSPTSAEMSWRSSSTTAWQGLTLTQSAPGTFNSAITPSSSDSWLDLKVKVYDSSGNYLEYVATNVSKREIPVVFELAADRTDVAYRDGDAFVTLTGRLTDSTGNPLSAEAAVPLELMLNGKKLATILDEYTTASTHVHDGNIRFEWHFNPKNMFSGPDQSASIQVEFDMGIYQKVVRTITLRSIVDQNVPPTISLISPGNNSLIKQGELVRLTISDDGTFTAQAYLDGVSIGPLVYPYEISTTQWSDGVHILRVAVTDDDGATTQSVFSYDVDAYAPSVQITYPTQGARVPFNSRLTATIVDSHLADVRCSSDGGASQVLLSPYSIDMTGWAVGYHNVSINASDLVGRFTQRSVVFEISSSTVVLSLVSPADASIVKPGTLVNVAAEGLGTITYKWCENGPWHSLGTIGVISTAGWSDGSHSIIVNATDDLGGSDQIEITIIIDGTPPSISLASADENLTFVNASVVLDFAVLDANFNKVTWTFFGQTRSSIHDHFSVYLSPPPPDGYFTVRITATDKANNTGTASFTFLMDHGPPEISFRNVEQNEAVGPGTDIDVDVKDFFVASVSWTIEDEPKQALADPYVISTESFGPGWHYLQIEAMDGCRQKNWTNISLYLDNTAPTVQVSALGTILKDQPCEITALIQDDFMVGEAQVFYEMSGGSFGSIVMTASGSNYSGTIEASELWDGMKLFVRANDTVGNTARSADLAIDLSDAPRGDDSSMSDWLFGSITGLLTMLVIVSSIIIVFFMVTRTRRVKGSGRPSRPSTPHRPSYSATYGTSSSAFKGPSSRPRPTAAAQVSKPVTRSSSVVNQRAVPMTYRASASVQRIAPVRATTTVIQAPSRPHVSRSPAGQDKISRVTPNSPVSELEVLFTPQVMSGLQIKRALDAEKKRQRDYT